MSKPVKVVLIVALCLFALLLAGCLSEFLDDSNLIFGGDPSADSTSSEDTIALVSFSIDGKKYVAEKGMRWYSWITSGYNTDGYLLFDMEHIVSKDGAKCIVSQSGDCVAINDFIESDGNYSVISVYSFQINGVPYLSDTNLWTWWLQSEHNTDGYKNVSGNITTADGTMCVVDESGVAVNYGDAIKEDGSYFIREVSAVSTIRFEFVGSNDTKTYTAEQDMTWEEFVNSSYNDELGFEIYNGYVIQCVVDEGSGECEVVWYSDLGGDLGDISEVVKSNEKIIAGATYFHGVINLPAA